MSSLLACLRVLEMGHFGPGTLRSWDTSVLGHIGMTPSRNTDYYTVARVAEPVQKFLIAWLVCFSFVVPDPLSHYRTALYTLPCLLLSQLARLEVEPEIHWL